MAFSLEIQRFAAVVVFDFGSCGYPQTLIMGLRQGRYYNAMPKLNHKPTKYAAVYVNGKKIYLGLYGTKRNNVSHLRPISC